MIDENNDDEMPKEKVTDMTESLPEVPLSFQKWSQDSRELSMCKCSVCLERFTRTKRVPITAPCGHTFCRLCVHKMVKGRIMSCPICREVTMFGFGQLGRNISMMEMLELFGALDDDDVDDIHGDFPGFELTNIAEGEIDGLDTEAVNPFAVFFLKFMKLYYSLKVESMNLRTRQSDLDTDPAMAMARQDAVQSWNSFDNLFANFEVKHELFARKFRGWREKADGHVPLRDEIEPRFVDDDVNFISFAQGFNDIPDDFHAAVVAHFPSMPNRGRRPNRRPLVNDSARHDSFQQYYPPFDAFLEDEDSNLDNPTSPYLFDLEPNQNSHQIENSNNGHRNDRYVPSQDVRRDTVYRNNNNRRGFNSQNNNRRNGAPQDPSFQDTSRRNGPSQVYNFRESSRRNGPSQDGNFQESSGRNGTSQENNFQETSRRNGPSRGSPVVDVWRNGPPESSSRGIGEDAYQVPPRRLNTSADDYHRQRNDRRNAAREQNNSHSQDGPSNRGARRGGRFYGRGTLNADASRVQYNDNYLQPA